jgi:hypothetical protein
MGTTGTKTGRTFQIQGEIVLIGTKSKKLFPKHFPMGTTGTKERILFPYSSKSAK